MKTWPIRQSAIAKYPALEKMTFEVTLTYSEPLIRQATFAFWWRSVRGWIASLLVAAVSLLVILLKQGDTSWQSGVSGTVIAFGFAFVVAVYVVHYRNSIGKLREMTNSKATFSASEFSFTIVSEIGATTMPWSAIKEIWQFQSVWLLIFSKAQFSTVPLKDLSPDFRAYLVDRVRHSGGSVS